MKKRVILILMSAFVTEYMNAFNKVKVTKTHTFFIINK